MISETINRSSSRRGGEGSRPVESKKMGDWGPVLIAVLFFVLLTPGLLCQIPGSGRGVPEFHSMRTSGVAIFVHTLLFFGFCAIFMVAVGVHLYAG